MDADSAPIAADSCERALADRERLDRVTRTVIGAAQKVSRTLGAGFVEKVYENALCIELRRSGLDLEQQRSVSVRYEGVIVGDYVTDLLVDDEVLVELKAVPGLDPVHYAQCINYLKSTGLKVCLLLNFGRPALQVKRIVNNF